MNESPKAWRRSKRRDIIFLGKRLRNLSLCTLQSSCILATCKSCCISHKDITSLCLTSFVKVNWIFFFSSPPFQVADIVDEKKRDKKRRENINQLIEAFPWIKQFIRKIEKVSTTFCLERLVRNILFFSLLLLSWENGRIFLWSKLNVFQR